jgi:hypothetical protein
MRLKDILNVFEEIASLIMNWTEQGNDLVDLLVLI